MPLIHRELISHFVWYLRLNRIRLLAIVVNYVVSIYVVKMSNLLWGNEEDEHNYYIDEL